MFKHKGRGLTRERSDQYVVESITRSLEMLLSLIGDEERHEVHSRGGALNVEEKVSRCPKMEEAANA